MRQISKTKQVTITAESHRRLKVFSAKYGLPMKRILDWFILTLLDEDGEPGIASLVEALEDIKAGKVNINEVIVNKSTP